MQLPPRPAIFTATTDNSDVQSALGWMTGSPADSNIRDTPRWGTGRLVYGNAEFEAEKDDTSLAVRPVRNRAIGGNVRSVAMSKRVTAAVL